MANPLSHLLKESIQDAFYPKVSSAPKLVIMQVTFPAGKSADIKEMLYTQLPRYWTSPGIVDCKILFSIHSRAVVWIESWESPGDAQRYHQSKSWQSLLAQARELQATVKTIINDSFELIE